MKKRYLLLLALPLLLTSCAKVTKIEYSDVIAKIANEESFTFYIGTEYCPDCIKFKKAIKEAKRKNYFNEDIYYVDANNMGGSYDIPYIKSEIRPEFNSRLKEGFFDQLDPATGEPMYNEGSFYTPSIFRYYKGVLVYTQIEGVTADKVSTLTDPKNINIGCYKNIQYLDSFANYKVCIRLDYPTYNEGEESFYILKDSLSEEEKTQVMINYNNFNEEKITSINQTITFTYQNNVLIDAK